MTNQWAFWIDRGGTFTDVVARTPDGRLVTHKLLSENSERYADAAIHAIRTLMGVADHEQIPVARIAHVKMGTTVATNALLERKGERTALITTRGFRDQLRIGTQQRPRIFDRRIVLPSLLYSDVFEIEERIGADGEVVTPVSASQAGDALNSAWMLGFRAIAICLMHGYRYHEHELQVAAMAAEIGFSQISVSHRVSPLMKFVPRGDTTVVDAYLSPVLRRYVARLVDQLPDTRLLFMQSNGGLTDAHRFQGKDAILSGPAGGIVGMVRTAAFAGYRRVIGFDMGGTSTDVSLYAGTLEREFDTTVAGVRLRAPMMAIHTIAAGGGSILHFDGERFRVGPDSAGADPGPCCYGKGGPLTVTDANVLLGKIQPQYFPNVFGKDGRQAIDGDAVEREFASLAARISSQTTRAFSAVQVAEGFLRVAVANMANAIRFISVARGHDVTQYALACFGGAGGQHACMVADALGMREIYIHRLAGVLSAYGMGLANRTVMREQSIEQTLNLESWLALQSVLTALAEVACAELRLQDSENAVNQIEKRVHLRYQGTDTALVVPATDIEALQTNFEALYRQRFSFLMSDKPLVIEAASVEVSETRPSEDLAKRWSAPPLDTATPVGTVQMACSDNIHRARVYWRDHLAAEQRVSGPALIAEENATTIVEPGWEARATAAGDLVLVRTQQSPYQSPQHSPQHSPNLTRLDPVMLEVFNGLFMSIAEQMGVRLANTAHSVNIKERFDFSCALFDAAGSLIANAPHMPVHLGSMGACITTVAERNRGTMRRGDVYVLNDPFHGGTHLPDVTVVTPVFAEAGESPTFFVASRGHHADIGGITPGSMPPFSRSVEDEGVLLDNVKLVDQGRFCEAELRALLAAGPHPARNIDQNIADLRAQIAANEKGAQELLSAVDRYSLAVVQAYMQHVQDNAEACVRRIIDTLHDGEFTYEMDNGAIIVVRVAIDHTKRCARIDFTGSSAQLASNFNAPSAVVTAAVLYVFRTLIVEDIPLNAGCLKPLTIIIPEGSMLNPAPPAATVAGNVETSQCITDALYGALGVMAASSGTMTNLTFGNERYQYYETVSGGAGAGPGFVGCDVVQVHMTNSRLTDPEVLEWRYPVRVEAHRIRPGSGGRGQWLGGHGATRKIRFLESMSCALLSGHQRIPNFGMAGGENGGLGRAWIEREDGTRTELRACDESIVNLGDSIVLETPGGGGYGKFSAK